MARPFLILLCGLACTAYAQLQTPRRPPGVKSPEVLPDGHTWINWRAYLHQFAQRLFE